MQSRHSSHAGPETQGKTIHWAKAYDKLAIWKILTLGKDVKIWQMMLEKSGLRTGDRVLDVGCGPGLLALEAKAWVGEGGQAAGIDASPEMIAVAREKAQRAGVQIDFRVEAVERLRFQDDSFDAVLSSLMMHHLPGDLKLQGLAEIRRVLKPGGCLVIVDFKRRESWLNWGLPPALFHPSVPVGVQDLVVLSLNSKII